MNTATTTLAPSVMSGGWLRHRSFDLWFIFGIAAVALLAGWTAIQDIRFFAILFFADLWLLGYHHVISTYTRLCFDRGSLREHRFLVFGLPWLVAAGAVAVSLAAGSWVLISIYLYWQWFHYTRQSWGISQVYRRKAEKSVDEHPLLGQSVFWLVPLWGILHRSNQDPDTFLWMDLKVIPVSDLAVELVGAAAVVGLGWWLINRAIMWYRGQLPLGQTFYLVSHFTIFYVAYILIDDINYGWLVVNIWHNAQYILFVWLFNTNRFKAGIDPKATLLSTISQPTNAWRYFIFCFSLSTTIYLVIGNLPLTLPAMVVIYQVINFHHYIVDGVIWKVRKKPLQKVLGVAKV